MRPITYPQFIALYRYDARTLAAFPDLDSYAMVIDAWTVRQRLTSAQCFRYMIACFIDEYWACRHLGREFTTIPYQTMPPGRNRERYETFNFLVGRPILTTEAYWRLLRYRYFPRRLPLSVALTGYVLAGSPIPQPRANPWR